VCSFEFLEANHLISEITPRNVAAYLRSIPRLDKVKVGNFLGKKDTFNTDVLGEYPILQSFVSFYL
jgi:hypothetical protein